MAEILGWRWEFGVQVPLLCVLLGVSCIVIPGDLGVQRHKKGMWETIKRFDTGGSTLLTISTTCFILGLVSKNAESQQASTLTITLTEPRWKYFTM